MAAPDPVLSLPSPIFNMRPDAQEEHTFLSVGFRREDHRVPQVRITSPTGGAALWKQ